MRIEEFPSLARRALYSLAYATRKDDVVDQYGRPMYHYIYTQGGVRGVNHGFFCHMTVRSVRYSVRSKSAFKLALYRQAVQRDNRLLDSLFFTNWVHSSEANMQRWVRQFVPEYDLRPNAIKSLRRSPGFKQWREGVKYIPGNSGYNTTAQNWNSRRVDAASHPKVCVDAL